MRSARTTVDRVVSERPLERSFDPRQAPPVRSGKSSAQQSSSLVPELEKGFSSMASRITYRSLHRYKYQLMEEYHYSTGFSLEQDVRTSGDYVVLTADGTLTIKKGYAWDGPSGPTVDTKNFMRGSLVHDALYQLLREDLVGNGDGVRKQFREDADRLLRRMVRKDGMSWPRWVWVYRGLRLFGGKAAEKKPPTQNEYAP
jgi:hypothetical protein